MPPIILKARCRLFEPNYRIIRCQFDPEPNKEHIGEYVVTNLMRERGEMLDRRFYEVTFKLLD